MRKMFAQRPSIRTVPGEFEELPLAEAQTVPKQLDERTMAIPSKAKAPSVTLEKIQAIESRTTTSKGLFRPPSYLQDFAKV